MEDKGKSVPKACKAKEAVMGDDGGPASFSCLISDISSCQDDPNQN